MPRVLVVEDEPSLSLLCRLELEDEGFEVRTAADSTETEKILETWLPDVVILDIRLGPESGLDLLRQLTREHPSIRTILFSGYSGFQEDFSTWLADAFLIKSVDLSELKRTAHRLLETRPAIDRNLQPAEAPQPMGLRASHD
ncbi:MAG: response regulator [Candidatus Krumholzibacteriia bacterium]